RAPDVRTANSPAQAEPVRHTRMVKNRMPFCYCDAFHGAGVEVECYDPLMLFTAAILLTAAALAAKAPVTHADVYLMKQVGAPGASPDGKGVVFSVNEPSYDETKASSDLWIVPAEGSVKPRRLTYTKGPESGVVWSSDSRRIAFSARREGDEQPQIY